MAAVDRTDQTARILIVEDESITALDLRTMLEAQGYAIVGSVGTGLAAIEAVRATRPDLVLLDIRLRGEIDGIAVAQAIHKEAPVVFLTAYGDDETYDRAITTQPYGYLIKPFEDRQVQVTVEIALQRHRLERKLVEAERWVAATLASIDDAVIAADPAGLVRSVNSAAERLTGWSSRDVVGRELRELLKIAEPSPGGIEGEYLLTRTDGRQVPIELVTTSIDDGSANVVGTVTVLRDIVDRKSRERRFRELLDSAPDPMVIVDSRGGIVLVNSQTERMFGYTRDELLGQPVEVLIPDRLRERHPGLRDGYFRMPRVREMGAGLDLFARRKDGSELPVEISLSPLETEVGTLVSAAIRDVTERKRAAVALELARDEAQASERHKAEFLASMSHEIRTPMNAVIGFTGLLLDGELSSEQREYARQVRSSAESLLNLINDILDFSKIEAGKLTIEPISFDLEAAAGEALDLFGAEAATKKIDLLLRYAPGTPSRIIGDPGRIRQVLTNLVGNAVKFAGAGHVLLDVEAEQQTEHDALLRVSVVDTGVGVPADKQGGLFQKFVQVDASSTRQHSGTGLGLAISKQLVDLMGGTIGFTSEAGRGSTFWFTLPVRVDEAEPPVASLPEDFAALRMLVVDDNPQNRALLDELLARWGIRGTSVASAAEGLRVLREAAAAGDPFQVGLLDFHMPEMDGQELGSRITADPSLAHMVLLMLSSAGQFFDTKRMKESGFAAYLTKPLRPSVLRDAIATAWASRSVSGETSLITRDSLAQRFLPPQAEGGERITARVLVVEDNPANQKLARLVLERMGCRVDTAANGREAVEMTHDIPYDIVFMDCQMPEMDGYQATGEIRAREGTGARLPVIALTAANMAGDSERCLAAGMDDHVSKPMRREDLRRALERWVTHRQALGVVADVTSVNDDFDPGRFTKLWSDPGSGEYCSLVELAASFLRNSKKRVVFLRQAVSDDDVAKTKEQVHSFKGSSSQYGATTLANICRELEMNAGMLSVAEATSLVDELERELLRLEALLERSSVAPRASEIG